MNLEDASLRAWPAVEQTLLGGWQLRFAHGFSKRANSVQPFAGAGEPFEERVALCERWYAERGRPCVFRLTPLSDPALDAWLDSKGYALTDPTAVLQRPTRPVTEAADGAELESVALDSWLDSYAALSGADGPPPPLRKILEAIRSEHLLGVLRAGAPARTVACGIGVLDDGLVGLFDLVTAPDVRRRGYGAELVRALLRWGAGRGAERAYLQVERTNRAAWGLYAKLGFEWVYDYWYRVGAAP